MSNVIVDPFALEVGGPDPTITFTWDPENDEALPGGTTFTRASVKQEFDGTDYTELSSGTIPENSAAVVSGAQGFSPDPADTNNCTESTDFTAVWVPTGIASRVDQGASAIGLNSYILTADTSIGSHRLQFNSFATEAGANYFIAKEGTLRYLILIAGGDGNNDYACFDLQTGVASEEGAGLDGTDVIDVGNGFYKCIVYSDPADDNAQRFIVMSDTATPGTGNYAFTGASETVELSHAQYSSGNPFATPPILTAGSAQSRVADVLDMGVAVTTAFSALLDVTLPLAIGAGGTITLLGPDATAEDIIRVDDSFDVIMDDGGTPVTVGTTSAGARIKISYGRDAAGRSASLDGATAVTGGAPGAGHVGDNFQLGSANSVNQSRCIHHLSTLFDVKKSDAQLEALSS